MGGMKLGPIVYEKKGKSKSNNGPFVGTIQLNVPGTLLISKVENCSKSKSETTFTLKKTALIHESVSEIFTNAWYQRNEFFLLFHFTRELTFWLIKAY